MSPATVSFALANRIGISFRSTGRKARLLLFTSVFVCTALVTQASLGLPEPLRESSSERTLLGSGHLASPTWASYHPAGALRPHHTYTHACYPGKPIYPAFGYRGTQPPLGDARGCAPPRGGGLMVRVLGRHNSTQQAHCCAFGVVRLDVGAHSQLMQTPPMTTGTTQRLECVVEFSQKGF